VNLNKDVPKGFPPAGIWGMNFKAMPELQWEYGYPMALGIIVSVCTLLFLRFRRMGWL
jgi:magnesium transporter